jgi:hypothetical protein
VPKPSRPPRITFPPTKVFRFDAETFELGLSGVEAAPGEPIRIYDPARTVVDLMRLRHRFGEPVALAALRRYLRRMGRRYPDRYFGLTVDALGLDLAQHSNAVPGSHPGTWAAGSRR